MKLTTEQIEAILDGAPDGATHVDFEGDYIFVNKTTNHLQWVGEPHPSNIINFDIKDLSLLREIISLRKRNAELEHDLKGSQILRSNQSETIRNYHKSKEELAATVERLREAWQSSGGCSSHNCCIKAPDGMGTNSGCRCYENRSKMMMLTQRMNAVFQQSPHQSLAEHDAEVARVAILKVRERLVIATGGNDCYQSGVDECLRQVDEQIVKFSDEYSQRIKAGDL